MFAQAKVLMSAWLEGACLAQRSLQGEQPLRGHPPPEGGAHRSSCPLKRFSLIPALRISATSVDAGPTACPVKESSSLPLLKKGDLNPWMTRIQEELELGNEPVVSEASAGSRR